MSSKAHTLRTEDVGLELDIFPGLHFNTVYEDPEVNRLSTHIIRMSVIVTVVQVVIAILGCLSFETADIVVNVLAVVFYLCVLRLAIRCVRKRNKKTMCFGITEVTSLKMYIWYLYLTLMALAFGLIRFCVWVATVRTIKEFNDTGLARSSSVIGGDNSTAEYTALVAVYVVVYLFMIIMNIGLILFAQQLNDIIKRELKAEQRAAGIVITKLKIFPGFHLITSYNEDEINELSTKVIRIGFALSGVQIVRAAISFFSWQTADIVVSLFNIFFYILVIRYAIRMVKKMNKATLLCGVSSLTMYIYCLYASFALVIFGLVRFILWVKDVRTKEEVNDSKFAQSSPVGGRDVVAEYTAVVVVYLIVFFVMIALNIAALVYAFRLQKMFSTHVIPM